MKRRTYKDRFKIPLDGDSTIKFYTKKDLLLASGYTRIVIGGRGPYIEFESSQIAHDNIYVPKHAEHKLDMTLTYYHEYRSNDNCFVKLYDQKMGVSYADYVIGMWYICPTKVKTDKFDDLLLPLYSEPSPEPEPVEKEESLFDNL